MSLITVASFSKPEEAHLLRMRLEAGGVPAYVQNENLIQMDWLYSNLLGGVEVQIAEEDAERAREIVNDVPEEALPGDRPVCPSCSSLNTAPDELPRRLSFASFIVIGFPLLFGKHRWKCADCGKTWNEGRSKGLVS